MPNEIRENLENQAMQEWLDADEDYIKWCQENDKQDEEYDFTNEVFL